MKFSWLLPTQFHDEPQKKVREIQRGLEKAYGVACGKPSAQSMAKLITHARSGMKEMDEINKELDTGQIRLFGSSPHEAMLKAMAADPNYPKCKPAKPNDPLSTPQAKNYMKLRRDLNRYKEEMGSLVVQAQIAAKDKEVAEASCDGGNGAKTVDVSSVVLPKNPPLPQARPKRSDEKATLDAGVEEST